MFCSKCGRTLAMEDQQCPHCGNPVGESRFEGTPYTSAQAHILPNAPVKQAAAAFTRTTYTTMTEEEQQAGSVDSRTTYRPAFNGASAPEDVRRDMRAAVKGAEQQPAKPETPAEPLSDEAIDTLNAVDEELKLEDIDTSELRSRPIESAGRAGISAGVEDYIQKLEANQTRRAQRRRRSAAEAAEEGDYNTPVDQQIYDDVGAPDPDIDTDQSEVFDDIDEDEFDEMRYGRALGLKDILKVALIMVLAAALIVGGVMWFRHVRGATSSAKIEGVSETLYNEGIELIKSHTENTYINDLVNVFATDGAVGLATRATADSAAIDALLPEESDRAVNDSLFVSTLQTIQKNIGNAILMDAQAAASGDGNQADSESRWAIVNNSVTQLEAASTAAELTAILNGEQVTVVTEPTPSPTPEAPQYETLAKGAKSDAVLELQTRLYELGFLMDDRDGAYGNKTQTAVKVFQEYAGLEATGIADSATQALLFSDAAPRTEFAQATAEPVANTADADYEGENGAVAGADTADTAAGDDTSIIVGDDDPIA